jgi:hypothetical protein
METRTLTRHDACIVETMHSPLSAEIAALSRISAKNVEKIKPPQNRRRVATPSTFCATGHDAHLSLHIDMPSANPPHSFPVAQLSQAPGARKTPKNEFPPLMILTSSLSVLLSNECESFKETVLSCRES